MKIKTLALLVALMALPAFASNYLYWMVDALDQEDEFTFTYATISLDKVKLENRAGEYNVGTDIEYDEDSPGMTPEVYAIFDKVGATFLFELFNGSQRVAYKSVAYGDLGASIGSSETIGGATLFTASDFTVVPEPTSGLLMLLGLAGLALKRKRA